MVTFTNDFRKMLHFFSEMCESGELDYMPMMLKSILVEMIMWLEDHEQKIYHYHSSNQRAIK